MPHPFNVTDHRAAAVRALRSLVEAGALLDRAASEPGLHPAVASHLRSLAAHAATWSDLLPYMTGIQTTTQKKETAKP